MKTSVIEVGDMLSVWSVDEVEKRIGEVPGVESVTVNYAAKNATVRYDETRLDVADIKSAVRQRGYASTAPPATPASVAPKKPPDASATAGAASAGSAQQDKGVPSTTSKPSPAAPAVGPALASATPKSAPDKS